MGQCDGIVVGGLFLEHFGEDEVAGAVEDRLDGGDLVGSHRLAEGVNDGHSARDRRFEGDAAFGRAGRLKQLVSMFAEQCLVGGDDVFSRLESGQDDPAQPG